MPIRVLGPDVAARIAAGEVVEGPASAVKELVENSLDAGASAVDVELQEGGRELLRVVDDGSGIPNADIEQLFQRHATSKLTGTDDLEAIGTLGFRGEALYSLASVAQVSLLTRYGDESGVLVEAGEEWPPRRRSTGAPRGTSVTLRGLFKRVPARRKFMGSAGAELGRVQRLLGRYALAFPETRFTLRADGRTLLTAPGVGGLREAVTAVYGASIGAALLVVTLRSEEALEVTGLTSPLDLHRANRSYICLLVNHRPVQSRSLTYAVAEAYHGLLPAGRSPVAILSLGLPHAQVDVNVHPAKTEVRLRREAELFVMLQRAVRETVMAWAPVLTPQPGAGALLQSVVPAAPSTPVGPATTERRDAPQGLPAGSSEQLPLSRTLPALRVLGQVQETYIVAEGPDGMYLIDQHAAHECVVYERLLAAVELHAPESQGLLDPVVSELSAAQTGFVAEQRELLERYGWQLEPFGDASYLVRAVPMALARKASSQALVDLLDGLLGEEPGKTWEERVAATVACHGAVRAGQVMAHQEMVEMVRLLERARQPHTCPHGRPTMVRLSSSLLEREFRRR